MELTLHTPPEDWYRETKYNNLTYWRIDYPPLTAYVSMLCGFVSHLYNPKSVALVTSRGYEEPGHKIFMRVSVLVFDVLIFFGALYFICQLEAKKYS